ncbi:hypothetical protein ACA910_017794 [Epithemia clementina (nom. ined.)]
MLNNPHFRIARVRYDTRKIEQINMSTTELLKQANIYARDLLTLNATTRQDLVQPNFIQRAPAAIVPRGNLILVSFGNIRAVVGLNEVYLLDAQRPAVQDFAYEIVEVFRQRDLRDIYDERQQHHHSGEDTENQKKSNDAANGSRLPYEIIFLEGLLRDTVEAFSRRVRIYEPIIEDFLSKVTDEVYSDTGVHQLVPLKDSLQSFEMQVKQSVDCLAALLDDDDAMLDLLLTEQQEAEANGREVDYGRHEHVELLLGVYARQLSMTLMEVQYMLGRLQSKQEFVALALDNYRNRLVKVNVHIAIAGLSLAIGTTAAGFFGMNLISGFENTPGAFYIVISSTTCFGAIAAISALNYISDTTVKRRAEQRLTEIETLSNALSDICALDHAMKQIKQRGKAIDKEGFRALLREARRTKQISNKEVDLLFDVFDKVKDGVIGLEDINFLEYMLHSNAQSREDLPALENTTAPRT